MENITPGEILSVADGNPFVAGAIAKWKAGAITWEQAMMESVMALSRHVNHLVKLIPAEASAPTRPLNQKEAAAFEEFKAVRQDQLKLDPEGPQGLIPNGWGKPLIETRIAYFREHGHWPEQAGPTRANGGSNVDRMVGAEGPRG